MSNISYPPVPGGSRMVEDPQFMDSLAHPVAARGPQATGIEKDPQFVAFVQDLVGRQTKALEESFRHELSNREEIYNVWRQESNMRETSLRTEIERLSMQLQEAAAAAATTPQVQVAPSEICLTSNGDTLMNDINSQAAPPQDIAPQIPVAESPHPQDIPGGNKPTPRRRRVAPRPPIPDSAPARNLRSRTGKQTQRSSTVTAAPALSNTISPTPPSPPQVSQTRPAHEAPLPTSVQVPPIPKPDPKKSPTQLYRLLDSELPSDIGGLKDALSLHIRILWGLSDAKKVPEDPQEHILRLFSSHIQTEAALYECQRGPPLIPTSLIEFRASIPAAAKGRVQQRMRMIEEHILEYVQTLLARFGLLCWRPDLRQSPYALYNSACRIIALDTFKQALVSHAYSSMKPNVMYATNMDFLLKLYDHIVHHYLFSRYKMERRKLGSVEAADKSSPQYRSRARLAGARTKFLTENRYPQRYIDLIDPKTTSDDEGDPGGLTENGQEVYWINKRPERSEAANTFIRRLDMLRRQEALIHPSKSWRERLRKVPEMHDQKTSEFTSLPEGVPIDYYLPSFFNALPPLLRITIASDQIAFLPDVTRSFSSDPDERLNDEDFLEKHGGPVLQKYKLDDLDGFDADEEQSGDEEMYDVTMRRSALVAQLSEESV